MPVTAQHLWTVLETRVSDSMQNEQLCKELNCSLHRNLTVNFPYNEPLHCLTFLRAGCFSSPWSIHPLTPENLLFSLKGSSTGPSAKLPQNECWRAPVLSLTMTSLNYTSFFLSEQPNPSTKQNEQDIPKIPPPSLSITNILQAVTTKTIPGDKILPLISLCKDFRDVLREPCILRTFWHRQRNGKFSCFRCGF